MNNILEIKFINTFIVKEKQERLIHEFSNPKKRENSLLTDMQGWRLNL